MLKTPPVLTTRQHEVLPSRSPSSARVLERQQTRLCGWAAAGAACARPRAAGRRPAWEAAICCDVVSRWSPAGAAGRRPMPLVAGPDAAGRRPAPARCATRALTSTGSPAGPGRRRRSRPGTLAPGHRAPLRRMRCRHLCRGLCSTRPRAASGRAVGKSPARG